MSLLSSSDEASTINSSEDNPITQKNKSTVEAVPSDVKQNDANETGKKPMLRSLSKI